MPFSRHVSLITGIPKNLWKRSNLLIQIALVPGHTSLYIRRHGAVGVVLARYVGPLDQVTQSGDVVVRPRHDHGSGG